MNTLKDVVLLIIVVSGIVGVCCIASGVRVYLDITNKRGSVLEGVCDDVKFVTIVIGILVYGIRF